VFSVREVVNPPRFPQASSNRCGRSGRPPSFVAPRTLLPSHGRPWDASDYSQERPGGSQERPTPYFTFFESSCDLYVGSLYVLWGVTLIWLFLQ
jgi:hypothetical protein